MTPVPAPDAPLFLVPHLAPRLWGGDRLGPGIGEAWDLSVHRHGPCRIRGGPCDGRTLAELAAAHPASFGGAIDLLAKRLDCAQDLSIQVHPRQGDPKTEAWVVLEARPGAGVYHGFARPVDAGEIRSAALDGSLPDLLRFVPVRRGDCVFVPSGTVHGIRGGLRLFELQQSADTTYRLFDWGRDRELHLEAGLACIEPETDVAPTPATREIGPDRTRLVECAQFFIDRISPAGPGRLDPGPRWIALFVLAGRAHCDGIEVGPEGTVIVPHAGGPALLEPEAGFEALAFGPVFNRPNA